MATINDVIVKYGFHTAKLISIVHSLNRAHGIVISLYANPCMVNPVKKNITINLCWSLNLKLLLYCMPYDCQEVVRKRRTWVVAACPSFHLFFPISQEINKSIVWNLGNQLHKIKELIYERETLKGAKISIRLNYCPSHGNQIHAMQNRKEANFSYIYCICKIAYTWKTSSQAGKSSSSSNAVSGESMRS